MLIWNLWWVSLGLFYPFEPILALLYGFLGLLMLNFYAIWPSTDFWASEHRSGGELKLLYFKT